ncbi:MAG: hypothetical protein M1274_05695, partial [Actinobacteria bacterium]|nr:hypothetical protein [Actinomycetota bacterium]
MADVSALGTESKPLTVWREKETRRMSTMRVTKRGSGAVLLLVALLLTAVLAGCGSGTEATTTTAA